MRAAFHRQLDILRIHFGVVLSSNSNYQSVMYQKMFQKTLSMADRYMENHLVSEIDRWNSVAFFQPLPGNCFYWSAHDFKCSPLVADRCAFAIRTIALSKGQKARPSENSQSLKAFQIDLVLTSKWIQSHLKPKTEKISIYILKQFYLITSDSQIYACCSYFFD